MSQLERVFFINRKIKSRGFANLKDIAEHFEVSDRTIKRDIEYMRYRLDAPLFYSRDKNGYVYSEKFKFLENLDEKMVLFYAFVKSISDNLHYIPMITDEILEKITDVTSSEYVELADSISYELSEFERIDNNYIRNIFESLLEKKQLKIDYINSFGKSSSRNIEPIRIINYTGKWYLLAFCHKAESFRVFSLSRVSSIKSTEEKYRVNYSKEEIDKFLESGFGIFKSDKTTEVTIRFSSPIYNIIKNQIWHNKQKVRTITHGKQSENKKSIELTFPVGDYEEILGKVLKYGENAEVISPTDFRERWIDRIRNMYIKFVK